MQSQAQQVENLISLLHRGVDKSENPNFKYLRIDLEFDEEFNVEMDSTDKEKLNKLSEKAGYKFQTYGSSIIENFCS